MTAKPLFISFCLILLMGVQVAQAQILDSRYQFTAGAQINLNANLGKRFYKNTFPGVKAFVGFSSSNAMKIGTGKTQGLLNMSVCLGIYNKSLGNSLNLLYQDNQIDFTSSFSMGLLYDKALHRRYFQTINNLPFYNINHDGKYAGVLTTNFIINNHRRHQTVGAVSITTGGFTLNYYNDGGPIIGIGVGDKFDRWWTGGTAFYFHDFSDELLLPFNRLELTFDQFTGYHKLMFELSRIIGMDVQDYDVYQSLPDQDGGKQTYNLVQKDNYPYNFNSSAYMVRYFFSPNIGANLGVIGSLRGSKSERYYAMQDIIHLLKRDPLHPNKDVNRIQYGFSYYYNSNVDLK